MAHISDMLVDAYQDHFESYLQTRFLSRGWTLAIVKGGRLQGDPEKPGVHIMVHVNHPFDPDWYDQPVGARYLRLGGGVYGYEDGYISVIGEVGGGRGFYRRLAVECVTFFTRTNESQDEAREKAQIIRGDIEALCRTLAVTSIIDDAGEQGQRAWWSKSKTGMEQGGPPSDYIWKQWVYITVETRCNSCP